MRISNICCSTNYSTCHKVTVLLPYNGYGYGRSTAIRSYVRAYCRYSYGRMTDTALIGVAYVRSCDLYAFSVEFRTKARTCECPFPWQFFSSTVGSWKRGFP